MLQYALCYAFIAVSGKNYSDMAAGVLKISSFDEQFRHVGYPTELWGIGEKVTVKGVSNWL